MTQTSSICGSHRLRRLLAFAAAGAAATLAVPDTRASTDSSGLSDYGKRVYTAMSGFLWAPDVISYDNRLDMTDKPATDWLVLTPPKTEWGKPDAAANHAAFFPERIRAMIAGATRWVDITTLGGGDAPSGEFLQAIKDGLTALEAAKRPVTVRILLGEVTVPGMGAVPGTKEAVDAIIAHTRTFTSVKVYTARHLPGLGLTPYWSWNHAKIIAVDGKEALTGGHNLEPVYLKRAADNHPIIHDVSMRLTGEAAHHAHQFAQGLWDEICKAGTTPLNDTRGGAPVVQTNNPAQAPSGQNNCPAVYDLAVAQSTPGSGGVPVIAMGRPSPTYARFLSSILSYVDPSPADAQIHAIINAAAKSIYISQQDIGPRTDVQKAQVDLLKSWWVPDQLINVVLEKKTGNDGIDRYAFGGWPIVADLAQAVLRGVHVYVVTGEAEGDYATGWSIKDGAQKIGDKAKAIYSSYYTDKSFKRWYPNVVLDGSGKPDLNATLCKYLHVAGFRSKPGTVPGTGSETLHQLTHGKVIIGDRQAFYIGSQNLYYSPLSEFGFFVDHKDSAEDFIRQYWAPMWSFAREKAVTGGADPGVPGTALAASPKTGEKGEAGVAPGACIFK